MSELSAYAFKVGARIPKGVTITGLLKEREIIRKRMGKLTTKAGTDAVESKPHDFVHHGRFFTWDRGRALRKLHEIEMREALSVVVLADSRGKPTGIQHDVIVVDSEGERIWRPVVEAVQDEDEYDQLLKEVVDYQREAAERLEAYRKFMRIARRKAAA